MNTFGTFAIASAALLIQLTPAAATVNDDVAKCRAAMAAHPDFGAYANDVKFERYREGRIRTVRFTLKAQSVIVKVFCRIEKGRVTALEVRAR